jgi:hypothetical protein
VYRNGRSGSVELVDGRLGVVEWSPRPAETIALGGISAGLALAAVGVVSDPPGRLLVGAAALLGLVVLVRDLTSRPRLSAGPDGVDVRLLRGGRHLAWPGLRVTVRETRRFGLRSRLLELDTASGPDDEGVLVLLGRRDLGEDPEAVARALVALAPPNGARG